MKNKTKHFLLSLFAFAIAFQVCISFTACGKIAGRVAEEVAPKIFKTTKKVTRSPKKVPTHPNSPQMRQRRQNMNGIIPSDYSYNANRRINSDGIQKNHPRPNMSGEIPSAYSNNVNRRINLDGIPNRTGMRFINVLGENTIQKTANGFKVGNKYANNQEDLIEILSDYINKKYAGKQLPSKLRFECYGFDSEKCIASLDGIGSIISSRAPKLANYNFLDAIIGEEIMKVENGIPIYYKTITIPARRKYMYAGKNIPRLIDNDICVDVASEFAEQAADVIKKFNGQTGLLTEERLKKSLEDANIPSSAILVHCQSFVFANLFISDKIKKSNYENKFVA